MKDIKVNFHSSICLGGEIYFDPFHIEKRVGGAKIVFITHSHYDHLDEKSLKNVAEKETIFVCTQDSAEKLLQWGFDKNKIVVVKPNQKFEVLGVKCETFPAYNLNKNFHPKENGWVGYKILLDGESFVVCGDSDVTDELKKVKTDTLFVPIGGFYTMDASEASALVNIIKPKIVVPMHYGAIVGGKEDEKKFLKGLDKEIECKLVLKV